MTNILIAPDSFKESLSAQTVATIIADTLTPMGFSCRTLPVADGGEGTTDSLVACLGGDYQTVTVLDPMGDTITAQYGIVRKDTQSMAVMEMASSSGLMLVAPENRNPLVASTYGVGQMIVHALDNGVSSIIMGIGGSATNDGGTGMLQALGVRFYDGDNTEITPTPSNLTTIDRIDISALDSRLQNITIAVACDVDNPLLGQNGATAIYGPQKGVTPETYAVLEKALAHFAEKTEQATGVDSKTIAGAGAAGGLGFALLSYLNADLSAGIELILDAVDFDSHVQWADIVITGEGKIDHQTIFGKTPAGVAKHAHAQGKPTYILAGAVDTGWENLKTMGVVDCYAITPAGQDLPTALNNAGDNLHNKTKQIAPLLK